MTGVKREAFGVYVHWPFCLSKCPYCDFNSHVRHTAIDEPRFLRAFRKANGLEAVMVASEQFRPSPLVRAEVRAAGVLPSAAVCSRERWLRRDSLGRHDSWEGVRAVVAGFGVSGMLVGRGRMAR